MIEAYCPNCKTQVKSIWSGDYTFEDYGIAEEDGIVQVSTCGSCDTLIENFMHERG